MTTRLAGATMSPPGEVVEMFRCLVALAGLALVAGACSSDGDDLESTVVEVESVSRPAIAGEVVEPLDQACQSVAFSDGTYFWALGGPVNDADGEWIFDGDDRLLQAVLWVDAPCGEQETRTVERVTVAWFDLTGESPEEWSEVEVVDAVDHGAGDGLQLATWCGVEGLLPNTAVALVDEETLEIETGWRSGEDGLEAIGDPVSLYCDTEAGALLPSL